MDWSVIFLCLCFVTAVWGSGNSLKDPYICGPPTCGTAEKFKYLPEIIYQYEYKVNVETYFAGSSNNRSTLFIKTNATIQFITPCEGLLQLSDVTLIDQDESYPVERAQKFIHAVGLYELRFAFHDGIISEICPAKDDPEWVLNFKRGILSLFQNSMKRFDISFRGVEKDIHGTCEVQYHVRGQEDTSLVLVKDRQFSRCKNRYKYMSILQTVRYDFQSDYQTWPVLKSESKCRITVDHHIYKAVSCRERHLFEPFSGRNSGAMTTVVQDLELKQELNKTDIEFMESQPKGWEIISNRSNLHHHHTQNANEVIDFGAARNVLKLLCLVKTTDGTQSIDENMDSSSTVGLWGRLVRLARSLHYPELSQLLNHAPKMCEAATKHMLDALPYIASPASVQLIKDKILQGEVDTDTRHEWLMSMAMIPRPKLDMLKSMLELLQKQENDKVVSFTVSSMAHSYCRNSGKTLRECCQEDIPKQITDHFQTLVTALVANGISLTDRVTNDHLTIGIKALGNIGGFTQEFANVLMSVVGDSLMPVPIRLAAVDAFRRTPCDETREYFLEMFREVNGNVEVRIASYLQVMKCPTLSVVRKIFQSLRTEVVNQVATFVASHLENQQKSSLPSRVEVQGLLTGHTMPHLDDQPDFRMFSANYEESVFFDQFNAGGNYEANVVFSPDSYIPRSVGLNLTVDMFGESINILEVKGRVEGFERYFEQIIERFFGTDGPLNKERVTEQVKKLRFFRSADEADELRGKIDDLNYKNEALKHQYPMAELGFKVFGNEISFWSAEGSDEIMKALERLNPQLRVQEILSGKEISYEKASLFLDTTFAVPTGSGLPLNMNLMGTSYVNTKLSGTVHSNFTKAGSFDFEGKIQPSVAVNIAATMGVVAGGLASCGIRLNSRLYTATDVEATLNIRGLRQVKLHLSLPTDKQEIFAAKSELIILHGDTEHQQQGLNQNRIEQNTCSWTAFDNAIGIKVCASYQFPNMTNLPHAPYFLMSGPAKYIISLEKADPSAKTYAFEYHWSKNETNDNIIFSFDTPDSKEKRMINAILSHSNTSTTAALILQSEKSTTKAKAAYQNLPKYKFLKATWDVDGRKQFDTMISLKLHNISHGYVWVPQAYLIVEDKQVAALSGYFKFKSKGGVTQCDVKADFQTKELDSHLVGYFTINGPTYGTNLRLDYKSINGTDEFITLTSVFTERALTLRRDLYTDLEMTFSGYPDYNFYAVLKNIKSDTHFNFNFNVSESKNATKEGIPPVFKFTLNNVEGTNGVLIDTELAILTVNTTLDVRLRYEQIGPKYTALALFNADPKSQAIVVSGNLHYPPGTQLYLNGELNVTAPSFHPCVIRVKVHEKQPKEYQMQSSGVWFDGDDFNIDAAYRDETKTNMVAHHVKLHVVTAKWKEVNMRAAYFQDNRMISFTGQGVYDEKEYSAMVRYVEVSPHNFTTFAEVGYNNLSHTVSLNADLNNNTKIVMEIHADQQRDIRIFYQRSSTPHQKRLSAALNWNANRNPEDRISVDIQLDNKGTWHHAGHATLYFPGRVINGEFEFLLRDWFCQWHVRTGWADDQTILWRVKMFSEAHEQTIYALTSSMTTPFDVWKDTSFNLMWRYYDNLQALNGSMHWDEKYLAFNLLADYLFKTNEFYGEINAVINSTLPMVPTAMAIAKHRVLWKKSADTLLTFRFNETHAMMVNSSWTYDKDPKDTNVTGRVTFSTPFAGFSKGFLKTEFVLGHLRDIKGVTYLDLEDKIRKIFVNGHMRRITNCMLVVNVTSPLTEAPQTTARFGFVEADRHLVAMVVTPNSTTGIEVLLKLLSVQDFHLFGHVALPVKFLDRATVTAKRTQKELDFRVGWGTMDFGFTGIWHQQSLANFVYVFKLYTPLEGFEENGLVAKNVYGGGLDTELSVRLSKHKFGIMILLRDTGKGLIEALKGRFQRSKTMYDQIIDNFDTTAHLQLDTLYYPTITFHAHMMKYTNLDELDVVKVNATLHLPDKPPIVLTNVLVMESFTTWTNNLNLVTPFRSMEELRSVSTMDVAIGSMENVTCSVLLYNGTYWLETSVRLFHEFEEGEGETYRSHLATVGIVTPLKVLPELHVTITYRDENPLFKFSADIEMPSFTVISVGRFEMDGINFVESSGSLNLTSPFLDNYFIKIEFKKDLSDEKKAYSGGLQIQQGDQNNYLFADSEWHAPPNKHIHFTCRGALAPVLPPSELAYRFTEEHHQRTLITDVTSGDTYYSLQGYLHPASLSVSLATPHQGFNAVKIIAHREKDDVKGSFTTDTLEYNITGKVTAQEPLEMALVLTPKGDGEPVNLKLQYIEHPSVFYLVSAHFTGAVQADVRAGADWQANFTDIFFNLDSPQLANKEIYFKSHTDHHEGDRHVVSVKAATPLKRISSVKGDADFVFGPSTGYLLCNYELPDMKGQGDLKWSFLMTDLYVKALGQQLVKATNKIIDLDIYYGNSTEPDGLVKTNAGFKLDLDHIWQIGANASLGIGPRTSLLLNALLPKPNVDVHTLKVEYDSNPRYQLDAEYRTDVTQVKTGLKGHVVYIPSGTFDTNSTVTWTTDKGYPSVNNLLSFKWDDRGSHFVDYALSSPLYQRVETFKLAGSFQQDFVHKLKVIKGKMHRPGNSQIGEVDVRYGGAKHTDGHFNVTTPFKPLPWLKSKFNINYLEEASDNTVLLFWQNKSASVNASHRHTPLPKGFTQTGSMSASVPLSKQHLVNTEYYYIQSDTWSKGNATVDLDLERFVKGSFNQTLSKSERNLDLATTDIEVENEHTPVGIKYIQEYDKTGNVDVKQATVFHLHNATKFNVTGKLDVFTYDTGKNMMLTAIHGNRTWTFENKYEAVDMDLKQGSKVTWAEDVWLKYDIHVTNMTTDQTESQQIVMNVSYPLRYFNLLALYRLQDTMLDGSARLTWDVRDETKTAELKGRWENPPTKEGHQHNAIDLSLSHPSFRKDVNLKAQYISTPEIMSNISLEVQYSDYENEYLKLESILTDNSNGPIRDYKFALKCTHPTTNLDLDMKSDINIYSRWWHFNNYYRFQKSLFYEKLRQNKLLIDMNNSAIQWERANETYFCKVNGTWDLTYPDYKLMTSVLRQTGNDTGFAVLSMRDKKVVAHYNSSDDISYHIIGRIVDTRSAVLDAWRDFDDVTTIDLASYIRLNHSRLLTSSVVWRPEIFAEIKSTAVTTIKTIYSQINETLVIIKEMPMEAHQALRNIWGDAKPRIRDFLEDLNDLHVIKDDLDEFERFLNESYNANDFYVKDVVEFTYYVLDEMALRNHLESLPGMVNDMWQMMGNTSHSIKQSLTYVVETVKSAYSDALESVNKALQADFMDLVAKYLEEMILQYDNIVRKLHMQFLEFWESTWVNATNALYYQWHTLLKSFEPEFFKMVSVVENFATKTLHTVVDFFSNQKQEFEVNPYFNYVHAVSSFVDRLYKDYRRTDVITVIKMYSKKAFDVITTKVDQYIPFKKERHQMQNNFADTWKKFMTNRYVLRVIGMYNEANERLKWWYDYFLIGEAMERVGKILYEKITSFSKTALNYEEMHRVPKTHFIFDPHKGTILLEQKLPMSWHAFNRTPDLSEISEYRKVRDFIDTYISSNKTLWSLFYEISPYFDMDNILPPFAGIAIMTGQGTLVTFDTRVFSISEPGTYLLTKDYRTNNFTAAVDSDEHGRCSLVLLTKRNIIRVDLYNQRVSVGGVQTNLPRVVDELVVDRQNDELSVRGRAGFDVLCHMRFRTCRLQVAGKYYASLGGLLGTYNNEQYDDMRLPNGTLTTSEQTLTSGWRIRPGPVMESALEPVDTANDTECDRFFTNKVSPLQRCFRVIKAEPLHRQCVRGADACALASAYQQLCAQQHVAVHVPDQCVRCTAPNGDPVEEGGFYQIANAPNTTDVVFIVEADYCNRELRKQMELFVEVFDSKLQDNGITDNRYAVVGYGGRGVYRRPRALYVDSALFADALDVRNHFSALTIDKADLVGSKKSSTADVYAALRLATSLPLRPAAPVTLVLLPCTDCAEDHMTFDYSTIYHNLMENSVTLHILMDEEFTIAKKSANRNLFGLDGTMAYTNKDYQKLVGDPGLRKQIRLPKEKLGTCASLAIETNGTIFTRAKLRGPKAVARRCASVMGARAGSAGRCTRARCECRAARLHCRPCQNQHFLGDLVFWNTDDTDDLIDKAMDPPALPDFL